MGQSPSKNTNTTNTITNNTINQDIIKTVNENLMNVSVDTLIKNANTSSSSVTQNNLCKVEVGNVAGDFNMNSDQTNIAKVDFSAVNSSSAANDMNTAMIQSLISQMKTLNGTDSAAALNAAVDNSSNTGFLSTGGSDKSKTKTTTSATNNVTNETITYIQNLFEQNINNKFSSETVNQCIGKTTQTNEQAGKAGDVGKNVNFSCVQTNSVDQVQKCEQLATAINDTVLQTANELGLTVVSESDTKIKTESTTKVDTSTTSTGPIQEVAKGVSDFVDSATKGISGIIDSTGGLISGMTTGWIVFFVVLGLVALVVVYSVFFSGKDLSVSKEGVSVKSNNLQSDQGFSYPPQTYGYPPYAPPPPPTNFSGGSKFYDSSSSSLFLTDSSSSTSLYDSSSSSHFTWINANEHILSGAAGKDYIITRDILLTL